MISFFSSKNAIFRGVSLFLFSIVISAPYSTRMFTKSYSLVGARTAICSAVSPNEVC